MSGRLRAALLGIVLLAVLVLAGSMIQGLGARDQAPGIAGAVDSIPGDDGVRVEVLNASGISGLARRGTERLRSSGYDVVFYGNASGFDPDSSVVLARLGSARAAEAAEAVARSLGVAQVRSEPDTTLFLDVTVVLGRDWAGDPTGP